MQGGAALSIRGLDIWAGSSPLIQGVDWTIMPNERWSLLGPNGCGKSTLLKEIADAALGVEQTDGSPIVVDRRLRVGILEQTAVSGADTSVRDEVMSRMGAYQSALAELTTAEEGCVTGADCELERLERAQTAFEVAGGYDVDARVSRVLKGLGFSDAEFQRPCSSFSGGWQMRIGLARLLLSEPEVLIMDEPTNHLDASARRWLAEYVSGYSGTVLVVSHDEAFVTVACDSIGEVAGGRLELYKSVPYGKFVQERAERQARAVATVDAQERERARMQDFIDRMGAKASKAKQAKDRQGKIDKLDVEMAASRALLLSDRRRPRLTLAPPPGCGAAPLALRGADIGHASGAAPVVRGVDLEVAKGMRLVLRGPNGAGKSTLLKALSGANALHAGERLADERLALGVFAQDLAQELEQAATGVEHVMRTVRSQDAEVTEERCRGVMGALGLVGEKATRRIGDLSGGEKARVALATFCLTPCNVLLLDEPTNHLDGEAVGALLEAIEGYAGAVIVVSHDRPFCEAIRCTHVGYVAGGQLELGERGLRDSDFSEEDVGVANVGEQPAERVTEREHVAGAV